MPIGRRPLLAALGAVPLAACSPSGGESPNPSGSGATDPTSSVSGTPEIGTISAVVFDGAFGTGYVTKAGEVLAGRDASAKVEITPTKDITALVEPELSGGTPPDLMDNSGPKQLPIGAWTQQLEDLTQLVDSNNLEGKRIRDTLYDGVLRATEQEDRLLGIDYALSVYGLWYSSSRLAAEGRTVPTAWDLMLELGKELVAAGKKLFVWSPDAANYYQELAITSAIKEGGHDVRLGLDNLNLAGWSHPAMVAVLEWLEQCVKAGLFGRYETYLEAQQAWVDGVALLYPSGAWLAKEMADAAGEDFAMEVAAVPTVSAAPVLPAAAVHAAGTEQFVVWSGAKNVAGSKELLRAMLSEEVTHWFAAENLMPTVVRGSIPTDLKSTALTSQTQLLAAAGEDVFSWRFDTYYGMTTAHNEIWTRFLSGSLTTQDLIGELQNVTNRTAEDTSMEHYTVE